MTQTPRDRRMFAWIGVGMAALLILIVTPCPGAEDVPGDTGTEKLERLVKALDAFRDQHLEWSIEQTCFAADAASLEGMKAEMRKEIDALEPNSPDRERVEGMWKSSVEMEENDQHNRMDMSVDIISSTRFRISEVFHDDVHKKDSLVEYVADGDGLLYAIVNNAREVTVSRLPQATLYKVVTGNPLYAWRSLLTDAGLNARAIPKVSSSPDGTETLELANPVSSVQMKFASGSLTPSWMALLSHGRLIKEFTEFSAGADGASFFQTVEYREYKPGGQELDRKQVWTLKKANAIADPEKVDTTHRVKPGYTVHGFVVP